jgi:chemotaxis protein methyltransferase CheR
MTPRALLAAKLSQWTGLDLERGGRTAGLEHLLEQRMHARGVASADAYVASLSGPGDPEVVQLLDVLTVGHTWFFRDEELMTALGRVLEELRSRGSVCAWIAGCSTGEEAYTLAMMSVAAGIDITVLGTDINSEALERARRASYSEWSARGLPPVLRVMLRPGDGGTMKVDERVRTRVRFQRHNLLDGPPPSPAATGWPLIMCRNVLIYFTRPEAGATLERLTSALAPGGWLFLGGTEVLQGAPPGFALTQIGTRHGIQRAPPGPAFARPPALPSGPTPPTAPLLRPLTLEPPSQVEGMLERALASVDAGQPADAIPICAQALEKDPLSHDAHLVSGIAFHMSGDPLAALHALRAALLLEPDLWVASFYLALTYERLGRVEEARREYRHVALASVSPNPRASIAKIDAYRDEIAAMARSKYREA